MTNPSKLSFILLNIKAKGIQLFRHIPFTKRYVKQLPYGRQRILPSAAGQVKLIEQINNGKPFMAGRFGTGEGFVLYSYWKKQIFGASRGYSEKTIYEFCNNAGFFPRDIDLIDRWALAETEACASLDILGVMNFVGEEWIVRQFCSETTLVPNGCIASAAGGWASALEGKKVLVIHPFTETIKSQYLNHREQLFPNKNALPLFDLQCIKAVQTIADETDSRFANWFEALDYMSDEASKRNFDIALVGCGAYGFQLAARIKQMGRQVVHMGGPLQTLFGIKGSRWDVQYSQMYNDAWVYPSKEEIPKGFEKVENGCYWGNPHTSK